MAEKNKVVAEAAAEIPTVIFPKVFRLFLGAEEGDVINIERVGLNEFRLVLVRHN